MNKNILFLVFISLIFSTTAKAQLTMHKLVTAGYTYQNGSFGELGGKLLFLRHDDIVYRLGASALMGASNSKFVIMPKIQGDIQFNFERGVDVYHSHYFLLGAEATTKYFAPKAGVTLLGLIDLTGGYAFPIGEKGLNGKKMKGLNLNFTINVPIPVIYDLLH